MAHRRSLLDKDLLYLFSEDGNLEDGREDIGFSSGGVLPGGPRSFRQVVTEKPKLGSEQRPVEAPFYVAPRFRTADRRYRWLSGRQCLAFGRIKFIESVPRQATMDVWMMD